MDGVWYEGHNTVVSLDCFCRCVSVVFVCVLRINMVHLCCRLGTQPCSLVCLFFLLTST